VAYGGNKLKIATRGPLFKLINLHVELILEYLDKIILWRQK